jgi:hypothetical protein
LVDVQTALGGQDKHALFPALGLYDVDVSHAVHGDPECPAAQIQSEDVVAPVDRVMLLLGQGTGIKPFDSQKLFNGHSKHVPSDP